MSTSSSTDDEAARNLKRTASSSSSMRRAPSTPHEFSTPPPSTATTPSASSVDRHAAEWAEAYTTTTHHQHHHHTTTTTPAGSHVPTLESENNVPTPSSGGGGGGLISSVASYLPGVLQTIPAVVTHAAGIPSALLRRGQSALGFPQMQSHGGGSSSSGSGAYAYYYGTTNATPATTSSTGSSSSAAPFHGGSSVSTSAAADNDDKIMDPNIREALHFMRYMREHTSIRFEESIAAQASAAYEAKKTCTEQAAIMFSLEKQLQGLHTEHDALRERANQQHADIERLLRLLATWRGEYLETKTDESSTITGSAMTSTIPASVMASMSAINNNSAFLGIGSSGAVEFGVVGTENGLVPSTFTTGGAMNTTTTSTTTTTSVSTTSQRESMAVLMAPQIPPTHVTINGHRYALPSSLVSTTTNATSLTQIIVATPGSPAVTSPLAPPPLPAPTVPPTTLPTTSTSTPVTLPTSRSSSNLLTATTATPLQPHLIQNTTQHTTSSLHHQYGPGPVIYTRKQSIAHTIEKLNACLHASKERGWSSTGTATTNYTSTEMHESASSSSKLPEADRLHSTNGVRVEFDAPPPSWAQLHEHLADLLFEVDALASGEALHSSAQVEHRSLQQALDGLGVSLFTVPHGRADDLVASPLHDNNHTTTTSSSTTTSSEKTEHKSQIMQDSSQTRQRRRSSSNMIIRTTNSSGGANNKTESSPVSASSSSSSMSPLPPYDIDTPLGLDQSYVDGRQAWTVPSAATAMTTAATITRPLTTTEISLALPSHLQQQQQQHHHHTVPSLRSIRAADAPGAIPRDDHPSPYASLSIGGGGFKNVNSELTAAEASQTGGSMHISSSGTSDDALAKAVILQAVATPMASSITSADNFNDDDDEEEDKLSDVSGRRSTPLVGSVSSGIHTKASGSSVILPAVHEYPITETDVKEALAEAREHHNQMQQQQQQGQSISRIKNMLEVSGTAMAAPLSTTTSSATATAPTTTTATTASSTMSEMLWGMLPASLNSVAPSIEDSSSSSSRSNSNNNNFNYSGTKNSASNSGIPLDASSSIESLETDAAGLLSLKALDKVAAEATEARIRAEAEAAAEIDAEEQVALLEEIAEITEEAEGGVGEEEDAEEELKKKESRAGENTTGAPPTFNDKLIKTTITQESSVPPLPSTSAAVLTISTSSTSSNSPKSRAAATTKSTSNGASTSTSISSSPRITTMTTSSATNTATAAVAAHAPLYKTPSRGLRILTLDGGGIRGLLMIESLKKIESDTGRRIWELFDLIAGTSTGGMCALALSCHRSLEDIALQYHLIRSSFEGQSAVWSEVKRFAVGSSHSTEKAESLLRAFFGDVMLSDTPLSPKVFVVASAVDHFPAQPYVFRNYELTAEAKRRSHFLGTCSGVSVYEAARATTSAPTFYEPAVVGGQRLVDGAILANNPSLVALSEAAALWPGANIDAFVALGTGTVSLKAIATTNLVSWAKIAFECIISADMAHRSTGTLLGPDRYFRLDPESLGDIELSEMRLDVLQKMLEDGRKYIRRNEAVFKRLVHALGCGAKQKLQAVRSRARAASNSNSNSSSSTASGGVGGGGGGNGSGSGAISSPVLLG